MTAARIASVCLDGDLHLQGPRLNLRPLTLEDVGERYCRWLADPEINAFLETRWEEQSEERIAAFVTAQNGDPTVVLLGIFRSDDQQHLGNIKLGPIDLHHRCGDVSFFIGETDAWGQGYAGEAIALVVECAFARMGLNRVQAGCYAANAGSARVLERVGFQPEGVWRAQLRGPDGGWQDHRWFGLLADEWEGLPW